MIAQVLDGWAPSVPSRIFLRPYSLLGLVFLIVLAIPSFLRSPQDWDVVYVPAAARLEQGEDIFQKDFVYPPVNAWLPIPFVGLPHLPSRALWYAINMTALAMLLLGAWKLSGGGRLEGTPGLPRREHAIFWLGLGCGISSCLDTITNQQTDLIVAALVIAGCLALVRQRSLSAGVWFGIAAAIKCTPLLWAPYLAWQKRWAACALVVVVAVGLNFIPDLTHPPDTRTTRLGDWGSRYLLAMAERQHDFGAWNVGFVVNQSIAGLCRRWLTCDAAWIGNELIGVSSETRVAPAMLNAVTWSTMFLLLAAGWLCARRTPVPDDASPNSPETGLHFGMILILMVLLSPHSSKPHFCTLLLPGFCVARAALNGRHRGLLVLLAAALTCAVLSNKDLIGEWLYSWTKWYGSLTWCAVLLYVGSCWVLLGNRGASSARAEDGRAIESTELQQAA